MNDILPLIEYRQKKQHELEKKQLQIKQLEILINRQNKIISHYMEQISYYEERELAQLSEKGKIKFQEKIFQLQTKIENAQDKKYLAQLQLKQISAR